MGYWFSVFASIGDVVFGFLRIEGFRVVLVRGKSVVKERFSVEEVGV